MLTKSCVHMVLLISRGVKLSLFYALARHYRWTLLQLPAEPLNQYWFNIGTLSKTLTQY